MPRSRQRERPTGLGAATPGCSTKRSCRPTKAATSISCARTARDDPAMSAPRMTIASKLLVAAFTVLLVWPQGAFAQMKVLISGGFSGAYEKLLPEFERESDIKVTTGSGASQGDGPQTIGAQLARGEKADV